MYEYYSDGVLKFSLQEVDGQLFGHCELTKWNKSTLVLVSEVWNNFCVEYFDKGYKYMYTIIPKDNKVLKFNLMFNSVVIQETEEYYLLQFTLGE